MNAVTLKFLLLAEDKASKAIQHTGGEVDKAGKKVGGFSGAAKVAMAGAGLAVVGFATSSINKFKQVTSESRSLQRSLGGTLEEASRMREAAILSGVNVDTFGKSMQKLDKTLVTAAGSTKASAALTDKLGFSFQDAAGHVKPMNDLLPQIADKFATMPDGPEKTALAMQLFGKAGAGMLPFLTKGSKGIAELEKQSDKFGTTINNKSIQALAAAREGERKWDASMDGLKITLGAQLLPMLTSFVDFIRDHIIPIVEKVTGFLREHQHVVALVAIVVGTLVVGLKLWAIAQGILNTVMAMNPFVRVALLIAALVAGIIYAYHHSETFRRIVQGAFRAIATVGKWMWENVLRPVFEGIKGAIRVISTVVTWLWRNVFAPAWRGISNAVSTGWDVIHNVFGWIKMGIRAVRDFITPIIKAISSLFAGIGTGLKWAYDHIIKPILQGIVDAIGTVQAAISSLVGSGISQKKNKDGSVSVSSPVGNFSYDPNTGKVSKRAHGGPVIKNVPYIVGEKRPELFVPNQSGRILPDTKHHASAHHGHHKTKHTATGHGGDIIIQFNGMPLATEAAIGRAVGKALEYAVNAGTKVHIKSGIV